MDINTLRTRYALAHFTALGCEPDLTKTLDWDLARLNREVEKMRFIAASSMETLHQEFSDFFKQVNGIRPHWMPASSLKKETFVKEMDRLADQLMYPYREAEAAIKANIAAGAKNREQAIKWLHDAYDTSGDVRELCRALEVDCDFFNQKEVAQ